MLKIAYVELLAVLVLLPGIPIQKIIENHHHHYDKQATTIFTLKEVFVTIWECNVYWNVPR